MGEVREARFTKPYSRLGKRRAQCRQCLKPIEDGEPAVWMKFRIEKRYPVKGRMVFVKWKPVHVRCIEAWDNR